MLRWNLAAQLLLQPGFLSSTEVAHLTSIDEELRVENQEAATAGPEGEVVIPKVGAEFADGSRGWLVADVVVSANTDQWDVGIQFAENLREENLFLNLKKRDFK